MRPSLRRSLTVLLAAGAFVAASRSARSGDEAPTAAPAAPPISPEEMMKRFQEAGTPGKHHAALASRLGTYDVEIESWEVPNAPPVKSKAVGECTWFLEGRFVLMRVKGMQMGMPLEMVSIEGYDNVKKKHVSVATNSFSTALIHLEGVEVDPSGKVQALYGALDEIMTGEHDKPIKTVHRFLSPDKSVAEVWDLSMGENGAKVIEMTFTRRKK